MPNKPGTGYLAWVSGLWLVLLLSALLVGLPFLFAQTPVFAAYAPPKQISTSVNNTLFPQLTPDVDGYLHLAWMEMDENWSSPNPGIFYSRWNGDDWSNPVKVSANTTGLAELPAISVDSNKVVHVVYDDDTSFVPFRGRIHYVKRQTNGTWTSPTVLPHPAGPFFYAVSGKITVDTSNNLHVVYGLIDDSRRGGSLYYTKYDVGTGSWSSAVPVSFDTDGTTPTLDTQWGEIFGDKQGNVHLIYWDWRKGIFYRKLSDGTWSTPVYVVNAPDVEYTKLAVDDNGNPFVIWFQTRDESVWVRRNVSGVWLDAEQMVTAAARSIWGLPIISITTNSKNVIAVGWIEQGTQQGLYDVVYRYYSDASWSTSDRVRLDRPWPDAPFLIKDKWDNQHLVWSETPTVDTFNFNLWYSVVQGTQQTIGTTGGTVTVNPNNVTLVTLDFANGALSGDTLITALIGPLPESVSPGVVTVPRAFTFGPSGTDFPANKKPIITFTYTDSELAGGDPRSLNAYVWDSQTNSYSAKSGTVNTTQKTLKVTSIDHFSLFTMAAPRVFTEFLPPFREGMSLEEDSTIPLRFKLTYHDGSLVPEGEVVVQLKQAETVISEFTSSSGLVRYQENNGVYKVNIPTEDRKLGDYQIVVFRDGPEIARASFSLVEEGVELEEDEWEDENEQDQE